MKLLSVFVLAILAPFPSGTLDEKTSNDKVEVEFNIKQKEFRSGETGYFLISFKPKKGIYITTDPPFEFTFDTLKQFFSISKAVFVKDGKGYLKAQQSVRQHFLIAKGTPSGSYKVKGTLIYYYCSDDEGWCSRIKQPVELALTVK